MRVTSLDAFLAVLITTYRTLSLFAFHVCILQVYWILHVWEDEDGAGGWGRRDSSRLHFNI